MRATEQLQEYIRRRNFEQTPEPRGVVATATGKGFVVQKHAARRLHYDFRLELDGVLLSWAVPKGPSLDPSTRRLAVRTEDHPLSYAAFEGIIPQGEYGGGTVIVWDRGHWQPEGDPHESLERGRLTFELFGQKLHGRWHLVRTGRQGDDGRGWLLFKGRDSEARKGPDADITAAAPQSALTGRTVEDVEGSPDRVWHSKQAADADVELPDLDDVVKARRRKPPARLKAPRAKPGKSPRKGDAWLHELGVSGERCLVYVRNGEVAIRSSEGEDVTRRFAALQRTFSAFPLHDTLVDGVVTTVEPSGSFYAFDLPFLQGYDLRAVPLERRKALLHQVLRAIRALGGRIRLLDHVEGGGARVFDQACALGVPSVTSRRRTSEYGKSWVEIPCPAKTNAEDAQDSEPVVQLPKWAQVSNPDRVLYPRQGIQKGDLAHYYHAVRDWMLPHLKGRPLTLVRCPQGHHRHCFFQKHHKKGTPDGIVPVSIVGEAEDFMAVANERGLLGLVQLGVLEVHVWGCHADRPNRPDRLVMDIDPDPSLPWNRLVAGAFVLREVLAELGLRSFVQTTGGKGLHVVFPIARRIDWNTAKEFCKAVADLVVRMEPDKYVANMAKAKRRGKIYIDYLRNAQGASAIASYSTRRHPHAPVATPISWDELSKGVQPSTFTVETVPRRVALLTEDPWPEYFELQQAVTAAARRKVKMG